MPWKTSSVFSIPKPGKFFGRVSRDDGGFCQFFWFLMPARDGKRYQVGHALGSPAGLAVTVEKGMGDGAY